MHAAINLSEESMTNSGHKKVRHVVSWDIEVHLKPSIYIVLPPPSMVTQNAELEPDGGTVVFESDPPAMVQAGLHEGHI